MCVACQVLGINIHEPQGEDESATPGMKVLNAVFHIQSQVKNNIAAALQLYKDPSEFPAAVIDMLESGYLEAARLVAELRLLPKLEEEKKGVH